MVVPRLVGQKVSQPVPDGCAQVGRTEGEPAQPWTAGELHQLLEGLSRNNECRTLVYMYIVQ
jgi:hypothetical protein